jgi:hypothetical protein
MTSYICPQCSRKQRNLVHEVNCYIDNGGLFVACVYCTKFEYVDGSPIIIGNPVILKEDNNE